MKKILHSISFNNIFLFSVLLLAFSKSKAQTTYNINYISDSQHLRAINPQCNIFEALTTVGSVTNQSWAGGVGYTVGKGIFLHTNPGGSGTTPAGTAYLLYFNFVPGNSYAISITTSGSDSYTYLGTSTTVDVSSLTNLYPTSNNSTCTNDTHVPNYSIHGYAGSGGNAGAAVATSTIGAFVPATGQQYLVLWGYGGNPNFSSDGFYISKITIVVTTPSISLSPNSLNYTCGNALSQTFTATNVTNTPNLISYTWNLGSTPNGWLLNGVAAPATYNTTGNTLALTSQSCNTPPHSIYAVGNFSTFSLNSNTVTPAAIMDISGPSSMCSQPVTYSISNLNCPTATYNWSATPAGNVSMSCTTCAAPTLTKIVNASTITLAVTVTGGCTSSPANYSKFVNVDPVNTLTGTYSTSSNTYPFYTVNMVKGGSISGQYSWPGITNQNLTHSGTATWYYGGSGTFGFYIDAGQTLTMNFSGTSAPCGIVTDTRTFVQSSWGNLVVTASPVPANGTIDVTLDQVPDTTLTLAKIQELSKVPFPSSTGVYLYDINSEQLLKEWHYSENQVEKYNLSLTGIKSGIYVLKVERNKKTASIKIIVN